MINRRDFLKLMGAAVGGVALTGCGGGSSGGDVALPNAFKMTPVFTTGMALPDSDQLLGLETGQRGAARSLSFLSGAIMMNDRGEIFFHAKDGQGGLGWYVLQMDYSGSSPAPVSVSKLIRTGDSLPDGSTVARVGNSDTNILGRFVTIVENSENLPHVYIQPERGSSFISLAGFNDPVPGANGTFGGNFVHLSLDDSDDLLLTGHYADQDEGRSYNALFYLKELQIDDSGKLLLRSDSLIPDSNDVISNIGIPCLNQKQFVIQAQAEHTPSAVSSTTNDQSGLFSLQPTCLIKGHIDDPLGQELLVASDALDVSSGRSASAGFENGDLIMGPRIGPNGHTAYVVHMDDESQILYFDGREAASTGYRSIDDTLIQTISAPVISKKELLFYLLGTDHGQELWVSNGYFPGRVLSAGVNGDFVDGQRVNAIIHGAQPTQSDSYGRICFVAEFEDQTMALMLGTPV